MPQWARSSGGWLRMTLISLARSFLGSGFFAAAASATRKEREHSRMNARGPRNVRFCIGVRDYTRLSRSRRFRRSFGYTIAPWEDRTIPGGYAHARLSWAGARW